MNEAIPAGKVFRACLGVLFLLLVAAPRLVLAQSAGEIVQKVVGNELWYSEHDHTSWMYVDRYKSPTKDLVKLAIQTRDGNLSEIIEDHGKTPSAQVHEADLARIKKMVTSASYRAQQRKNAEHDDKQATNLLKMLPDAFVWKVEGRKNGVIRLSYHPNPDFSPPTMSSRVLAAMSGTMTVDAEQMRLEDLFGRLDQPVEFAWGLLGHLNAGGTFQVTRTQVAPHEWQITGTHVHISGHILFFKDIGDQEDEVTSDYHRVPPGTDLVKASQMLENGEVAKILGVADPFAK